MKKNLMDFAKSISIYHLGYFCFLIIFLFTGLGVSPLIDWDENIYAEMSKQMVIRGDYLNTYINNEPFNEKPPFFFWLQVLSFKLFGISEFSARFPAAVLGFFSVLLCILVGRQLYSLRLGMLWGLLYITSLFPAILARSSSLEITFNFWIATAIFSLFLYDNYRKEELANPEKKRSTSIFLLCLAAIAMGAATLTKSPFGGALPLFSFIFYKFFNPKPTIPFKHIVLCGILALAVPASWLVSSALSGSDFFLDSLQFQIKIIFNSLQDHRGPFYYHFIALLFCFFPWTVFLFLIRRKTLSFAPLLKKSFPLLAFWVVFVLLIFSIVKTKLPHYTASIYFPFSLLVALLFEQLLQKKYALPKLSYYFFLAFGLILGGFFFSFHWIFEYWLEKNQVLLDLDWDYTVYFIGLSLIIGSSIAFVFFLKNKFKKAIISIAITCLFFSQGLWRIQIPLFLQYNQDSLLEMVIDNQTKGNVVLYRWTSFAAIFYGNKTIPTFYSSKFAQPEIDLNQPQQEDLYIITRRRHNQQKLEQEFPKLQFIREKADFFLYLLPRIRSDNK